MRTLTQTRDSGGATPPQPTPCLFVVLDGDLPTRPSRRVMLHDLQAVTIGRGDGGDALVGEAGRRVLALQLDDRRASTQHARLERDGPSFVLIDAGSKNGTLVGGLPVERATLRDGDVIEIGHTLLLFRAGAVVDRDGATVLDGRDAEVRATGLTTLCPELARDLIGLAEVATSVQPVVVLGESGTGKELIARAVHRRSGRTGALVAVNCAALPETLVEAELFGHKKGAFTGATTDRDGFLRAAAGGTLFLDEIGDLPAAAQAVLLRALQEREVVPVGATTPIAVDFRLVAATHRDLAAMVTAGKFREDLYARIAGFTLRLPPLRRRREDFGLIIAALLGRLAGDRAAAVRIEPTAARALLIHPWPRNIRELEKCLGTALALAGATPITLAHLQLDDGPAAAPVARTEDVRARLVAALADHHGNVSAVARALGTTRMQVHRWAKRFGIDLKDHR